MTRLLALNGRSILGVPGEVISLRWFSTGHGNDTVDLVVDECLPAFDQRKVFLLLLNSGVGHSRHPWTSWGDRKNGLRRVFAFSHACSGRAGLLASNNNRGVQLRRPSDQVISIRHSFKGSMRSYVAVSGHWVLVTLRRRRPKHRGGCGPVQIMSNRLQAI